MKFVQWIRYISYLLVATSYSVANAGSYEQFFRAVVGNDSQTIEALVARGFDPNAVDEDGQPGIFRALLAEAPHAALTLARLPQSDPEVRNRAGETALMMAALKGQLAVCRALVERGAEVNRKGWTPLHYAASGNALAVLRFLLAQGAVVDARAPNGRTPLMLAAQFGSEDLVETLLAAGADAAASDRREVTAADLARSQGRDWLAERLEARSKTAVR